MHLIATVEPSLIFHREITLALRSLIVTEMRFNDTKQIATLTHRCCCCL
jgi:hypothetical protein